MRCTVFKKCGYCNTCVTSITELFNGMVEKKDLGVISLTDYENSLKRLKKKFGSRAVNKVINQ